MVQQTLVIILYIYLNYNVNCQEYNRSRMKKYESVKRIDLVDRQSVPKQPISRLQSVTRSSQRSVSKQQNQYFQCYTDRSRQDKINQFSVHNSNQNSHSISLVNPFKCNIKTFIRLKPLTKNQIMENESEALDNGIDISDDNKVIVDRNLTYSFDKVFEPQSSQKKVYQTSAKQLIKSFINGYNGTIFAYGQTGSGKTFTMFGGQQMNNGIIPQAIEDLFVQIESQKGTMGKNISLSCSMFEIYKQNICDLMSQRQKEIKIKQNGNGSIQIENLIIKQVSSKQELLEWIGKGSQLRKTRGTQLNQRSSRSHLVFTLYLSIKVNESQTKYSKLNLVDLAGSQKVSKTKVSGQGLQEAIKINLSLSCLGNTIYALSRGQEHIPFRDSKLTRVLQESLSGNSITRVIITCSMLPSCKQETISSLKFANRIKKIKTSGSQNLKKLNEQSVNKFMYQTLKANFQTYQQKLQKIKNLLENSMSKMTKEQIIQSLKNILNSQSSQNQFLSSFYQPPLQTFRSPSKQQSLLQYQNYTEAIKRRWSKGEQPSGQAQQHKKRLEEIIMKQEKLIQSQAKSIQRLKNKNQERKVTQKLKILKTNSGGNNILSKIKQLKNKNKQEQMFKQNIMITFRERYDNSQKKNTEDKEKNEQSLSLALYEIKQIVNVLSNQKQSYDILEREVLLKQVKALAFQVNELRKIVSEFGNYQIINNLSNQIKTSVLRDSSEQQFLKAQLMNKQKYIDQLQKTLLTSFNRQLQQIGTNKNEKQRLFSDMNFQKNIKEFGLITSPASSCCLSQINSNGKIHIN